jgi:hypothetical protein
MFDLSSVTLHILSHAPSQSPNLVISSPSPLLSKERSPNGQINTTVTIFTSATTQSTKSESKRHCTGLGSLTSTNHSSDGTPAARDDPAVDSLGFELLCSLLEILLVSNFPSPRLLSRISLQFYRSASGATAEDSTRHDTTGRLLVTNMYTTTEYAAPSWMVASLSPEIIPKTRLTLASLPTPIHRFPVPGQDS